MTSLKDSWKEVCSFIFVADISIWFWKSLYKNWYIAMKTRRYQTKFKLDKKKIVRIRKSSDRVLLYRKVMGDADGVKHWKTVVWVSSMKTKTISRVKSHVLTFGRDQSTYEFDESTCSVHDLNHTFFVVVTNREDRHVLGWLLTLVGTEIHASIIVSVRRKSVTNASKRDTQKSPATNLSQDVSKSMKFHACTVG